MTDYPSVDRFESATIVLPVMNETTSLEETVRIILRDVKDRTKEILIVVCERTTAEAMATVDRLSKSLGGMVRVHSQKLPFLGGAHAGGLRPGPRQPRGHDGQRSGDGSPMPSRP